MVPQSELVRIAEVARELEREIDVLDRRVAETLGKLCTLTNEVGAAGRTVRNLRRPLAVLLEDMAEADTPRPGAPASTP